MGEHLRVRQAVAEIDALLGGERVAGFRAFSGRHDNSVTGVANKDYDAAPIADSVMFRMFERNVVPRDAVRSIYKSEAFPTTAYGMAHNLPPDLQAKIREAFFTFPWEGTALYAEFQKILTEESVLIYRPVFLYPVAVRNNLGNAQPSPYSSLGSSWNSWELYRK